MWDCVGCVQLAYGVGMRASRVDAGTYLHGGGQGMPQPRLRVAGVARGGSSFPSCVQLLSQ
ncbi:hypothetical protein E2C01_067637 [Portunus trituberculatus]|uniref:Uncharacterized protein n=1 Tax=Portunus trituberculatus TaxID=210409 RepID=A0A5B7HXZ2_PORTR|nr:hypothetical protein [Portunus trituberculatus]